MTKTIEVLPSLIPTVESRGLVTDFVLSAIYL